MLFSFPDAGFDSLAGSRSTQAAVIILGLATPLRNLAQARGCLLWAGASGITRVARPSLGAEVIALINALDVTVRYQSYIFELLTGQFRRDLLGPSDTLPLINPFLFGKSPTPLAEVRGEYEQPQANRKPFLRRV